MKGKIKMSICDKGLNACSILKMTDKELNFILDRCEKSCEKYHQCDTALLIQDELKLKRNECLKCPYCESYQDFSDCPDLFYFDSKQSRALNTQAELLQKMQEKGFNVVTCGHCGEVFIHTTSKI